MNVRYLIFPHFFFFSCEHGVGFMMESHVWRYAACYVWWKGKERSTFFANIFKDRVFWVLPASENENPYDVGDYSPHQHLHSHPHLPTASSFAPPFSAHVPVLEPENPRRYPSIHASMRLYPRTTPHFHYHTPGYPLVCVSSSIAFSALRGLELD